MSEILKLSEAWRIVAANDYQSHMARVGQAEANAQHVKDWLAGLPLEETLHIAGAGPGQMFDFIGFEVFAKRNVVFSDVNREFLHLLEARLVGQAGFSWQVREDDIEESQLAGPFPNVALVLVLENVDWRKALLALEKWAARRVLIVLQENPAGIATSVTPGFSLPGTMNLLREHARPHLIPRQEVETALIPQGFRLVQQFSREVLHGKQMWACYFERS